MNCKNIEYKKLHLLLECTKHKRNYPMNYIKALSLLTLCIITEAVSMDPYGHSYDLNDAISHEWDNDDKCWKYTDYYFSQNPSYAVSTPSSNYDSSDSTSNYSSSSSSSSSSSTNSISSLFKAKSKSDCEKFLQGKSYSEKKKYINEKNSDGDTPLHKAAYWAHWDVAEYLIKENAEITHNKKNETPLDAALKYNKTTKSRIISMLMDKRKRK